jgi:WD40 repeat protein
MKRTHSLLICMLLVALLSACQPGEESTPVPTSVPATRVPSTKTPTSIPPTETAMPTPTDLPPIPTRRNVLALRELADLGTGKGPAYSQDWSPDGLLLATADTEKIRLWDASARRESGVLTGHATYVWGLTWSPITPDGTSILASASQDGQVKLWDVNASSVIASLYTGWAFCVDWSPDGQQLVVGTFNGEVQIWDVASQQMLTSWQSPTSNAIISIGWSPDGKTIASGELTGEIYLWSVAAGRVRQTIDGYTRQRSDVNGLAWSPDGNTLATATQDGKVRLWDSTNGQMILEISAHSGWARGIAWSPNGELLASTGEDMAIRLWDPATGLAYAEERHNRLPVWSVSWSPDGTMVASGAGGYEQRHVGATIVWRVP